MNRIKYHTKKHDEDLGVSGAPDYRSNVINNIKTGRKYPFSYKNKKKLEPRTGYLSSFKNNKMKFTVLNKEGEVETHFIIKDAKLKIDGNGYKYLESNYLKNLGITIAKDHKIE